jgi:hypothetical protein
MEQVSVKVEETGPMAPGAEIPQDAPQTEAPATERPAWLPEGFETPEQLAEAYKGLSQKQEPKAEQPVPTADEVQASERLSKFSQEFFSKGNLSEDSYKELSKMGYPRQVVDQFIAGQKAVASAEEQQVFSSVGGQDSYQQMIQWAGQNLSKEETEAYNEAVESGNLNQVMFAVKGLHARYSASGVNSEPKLMKTGGKTTPGSFNSTAEVVAAMSDPRYKTDSAYRSEVERKLANSNVI